ncbi:MAG: response regulator, partial [Ferruginibacter sp.]
MSALPDFIFLDLNMPKVNGRDCLASIKKNERFSTIPVIIYSTSSQKAEMDQTVEMGAAFFLQKPNRFEDLKRALANIISRNWE